MSRTRLLFVLAACCLASAPAQAQIDDPAFGFEAGPTTGRLGLAAMVPVPANCHFAGDKGAKNFLLATQNIPSGKELGVLLCGDTTVGQWFVIFTFDESGLVKDDEGKSLDSKKLFATIRDGTNEANKVREKQGWSTLQVLGWLREPYYDENTHNLTWSLRAMGQGDSSETINHSVRLLGRRGVMNADLVADVNQIEAATAAFDSIVADYAFLPGSKYNEWKEGDAVAKYGLTALIAGGAGVAAAKLGLFGKAWKLILGILLALKKAVIVIVAGIAAFFKKIFRKKEPEAAPAPAAASPAPAAAARAPSGALKKPDIPANTAPPPK